jgi:preprotein translocase subunit SecE
MSWSTAGKTFHDFGIIIAVSLFIAAIFALIDFISTFI